MQILQFIPNMDGFPNGRRLEDDVVRIELQAVSGVALAAIGLWYDDFNGTNPVTQDLLDVLTYNAGVTSNDAPLKTSFPYVASPWAGTHNCDCNDNGSGRTTSTDKPVGNIPNIKVTPQPEMGLASPEMNLAAYPNPSDGRATVKYSVDVAAQVRVVVYDLQGKLIKALVDKKQQPGVYTVEWDNSNLVNGTYIITAVKNGAAKQVIKVVKN